jgi:hypothetical protein
MDANQFDNEHFARRGEPVVLSMLESNQWGARRASAIRWLAEQEAARSSAAEELRRREIVATESSAKSAETSARYAKLAVVISVVALLVSALSYLAASK